MVIWEIVTDCTVLGFGVSSTQVYVREYGRSRWCVWALGPVYSPAQVAHLRNLSHLKASNNRWEKTPESVIASDIGLPLTNTALCCSNTDVSMCLLLLTNQNVF